MSMWFFEDVAVDYGAVAHLHEVALRTATRLHEASQRRPQLAARNLARCAGPFAEDLADHTIRLANCHRELAEALVTLAATAASAAREAHLEQARREQLRLDYQASQAAEALANAAAAAVTGTFAAPAVSAVSAVSAGAMVAGSAPGTAGSTLGATSAWSAPASLTGAWNRGAPL